MANFALIGAAGYVAQRHLQAIHETGHRLVAAVDPHDSVGVLDRLFPDVRFFKEIERFDRHLEKLRRRGDQDRIHYVSICSPNNLHDAHVRLAMRVHADAICEKPVVISPWNLDQLAELEREYGQRVHTVLQLRLHPTILELKRRLETSPPASKADVVLTYCTRRGPWYHVSWKGSEERSGGLAMNIGVHFFDALIWLFGPVESSEVHLRRHDKLGGTLTLRDARVRWFLSVDGADLPDGFLESGRSAHRSLTMDGQEVVFTEGFTSLHTRLYEEVFAGRGFGIQDARPSIELVHRIRDEPVRSSNGSGVS